jgi:hypothetical protein
MARVVRETVAVAVVKDVDVAEVVSGVLLCVCADATATAARTTMARDRFFTGILDLGEI